MKDIDYVKDLLTTDYPTERSHEIAHPPLDQVIQSTTFDYLAGTVEGEVSNGAINREGNHYLWFKHSDKSILSHRFISAVTLGKWVPRECDIDHINNNPSDNSPTNLRITTPRDNAGNRRRALLSELIDIESVEAKLEDIKAVPEVKPAREADKPNEEMLLRRWEHLGPPKYTGISRPGNFSGIDFYTTVDSWHWYPDGTAPDAKDFVGDL